MRLFLAVTFDKQINKVLMNTLHELKVKGNQKLHVSLMKSVRKDGRMVYTEVAKFQA